MPLEAHRLYYPQDGLANFLGLCACLLPLLAYPFLPSRIPMSPVARAPPSSNHGTLGPLYCLLFTSLSGVSILGTVRYALIHLLVPDPSSEKLVHPTLLIIYVNSVTFIAAAPPHIIWNYWSIWYTRIGYREPIPPDFILAVSLAVSPPCFEFSDAFIAPHVGAWYKDWMMDGWMAAILAMCLWAPMAKVVCKIARRDVSWWYWVRKTAVKEKAEQEDVFVGDDPWWSWLVFRVVMLGSPVLSFMALFRILFLALS